MKKWLRKQCSPRWWKHMNGSHTVRGKRDLYGEAMEPDEDGYQFRKYCSSSFYSYITSSIWCVRIGLFSKYHKGNRLHTLKSALHWFKEGWKNE